MVESMRDEVDVVHPFTTLTQKLTVPQAQLARQDRSGGKLVDMEPDDVDTSRNVTYRLKSGRGSITRRRVDHALGTPMLLALGLSRVKRPVPKQIRSIGILSPSAFGDTIVASAVARDLNAAGFQVIVFTSPAVQGVATLLEGFDNEAQVSITHPVDALRVLRDHPTDVLIDIMTWPRMTGIVSTLGKAQCTIGFRTAGQHRHFAYDIAVPHTALQHEVDNYRALVAPLGVAGNSLPLARSEFREIHAQARPGFVVLHPWAGGFRSAMREWPLDRWSELARTLIGEGASIAITGAPADRSRADQLAEMIDCPGKVENLAGIGNILDTARHVAKASVVVSVNTGIMHLAAALDIKLVALHGPTDPSRWGPLGKQATVIGPSRAEGGAFLNHGFEYPNDCVDCMRLIRVEDVLALVRSSCGLSG